MRWKFSCLLLASVLLTACASSPEPYDGRQLRRGLDTETVSRVRHAVPVGEAASSLTPVATRRVASTLARLFPGITALLESEDQVGDFEKALVECARQAEREVNFRHFGNRAPTRQECGEEVEVDGCPEPITRAMLLGQQKHTLALQCANDVLKELWPAPFSIEQRYRYYPNAKLIETVSRQREEYLLAQGCTHELWRTIKPDIVLHAGRDLLRAAVIVDFKFPCPDTNPPQWKEYGEGSAYEGFTQHRIYRDALGGEPVLISPRRGVSQ